MLCQVMLPPVSGATARQDDRNVRTARSAIAMYEWITITAYPWIKAIHVIAVIAWMAAILYLPRLFVYHCEAEIGLRGSPRPSRSWSGVSIG